MRIYSQIPAVQDFYVKHGPFVYVPDSDWILFKDGAKLEMTRAGVGMTLEPPSKKWERAKLVAQYYEIRAKQAEDEFYEFREACRGNGHIPWQYSDRGDRLIHLKKLRGRAVAAKEKLRNANKKVKELTPFWLVQKKKAEADQRRSEQEFFSKVNDIQL